jgi:tRNA threonylcarbamoyladenosine biosynthesis protein TsaB
MFAYCSLAIVAHAIGRKDLAVIADARRDAWHCYQIGNGLRRVESSALTGELVMPDGFRSWTKLPPGVRQVPYSLADLLPQVSAVDLFLRTNAPDAFLHEEPSYVTWTPQIHRAPSK